jgi:hypothetical protein
MNNIQKIKIQGAGVSTSNGEFVRNTGGNTWFYSDNNSHIEHTVDGWFLIDSVINDQTYMFDHNFQTVIPVGDAIEPTPTFEITYFES